MTEPGMTGPRMDNDIDTLECDKWIGHKYAIIYKDNVKVGYCITAEEADVICDKNPIYQWDFSKKKPENLPLMVST